jgi:hypothetical protein
MNDKSEATRAAKNGNNYTKTVNKVACKKKKKCRLEQGVETG